MTDSALQGAMWGALAGLIVAGFAAAFIVTGMAIYTPSAPPGRSSARAELSI
jgi:hypothetical protein